MKMTFKISRALLDDVRQDLARPHPFAGERVGFIAARCTRSRSGLVILASRYVPVPDDGYAEDYTVGAMMNQQTITTAMQIAYSEKIGIFHVHEHPGRGKPRFSSIDLRENAKFVQAFVNVRSEYPHGAIVLSDSAMAGLCRLPQRRKPEQIEQFTIVGAQLEKIA